MRLFLLLLLLYCYFCATLHLLCYIATVLIFYCASTYCYIATLPLCPSSTVAAAAGYNAAQRKPERLLQRKIIVMLAIVIPIPTNKIMQKGTKQTNKEKHAVLKKVKTL